MESKIKQATSLKSFTFGFLLLMGVSFAHGSLLIPASNLSSADRSFALAVQDGSYYYDQKGQITAVLEVTSIINPDVNYDFLIESSAQLGDIGVSLDTLNNVDQFRVIVTGLELNTEYTLSVKLLDGQKAHFSFETQKPNSNEPIQIIMSKL